MLWSWVPEIHVFTFWKQSLQWLRFEAGSLGAKSPRRGFVEALALGRFVGLPSSGVTISVPGIHFRSGKTPSLSLFVGRSTFDFDLCRTKV